MVYIHRLSQSEFHYHSVLYEILDYYIPVLIPRGRGTALPYCLSRFGDTLSASESQNVAELSQESSTCDSLADANYNSQHALAAHARGVL